MTLILAIECAVLVLLFLCSAFFSSAETALFSLNTIEVHHIRMSQPKAGSRIQYMLVEPTHLLSTILIGNTLVNITAAVLGYAIAEHLCPSRGELIAIPAITVLLLIFGEVAPKRLAMSRAKKLAAAYSGVLTVLTTIMRPAMTGVDRITGFVNKHRRVSKQRALTEDEFLTVVEVGEEEGVLDKEERTMVDGIIGLEETQASDVMTPRVDLIGIDLDDPLEECRKTARSAKFRYLPVYKGSLDQAEGFLDLPRFLLSGNLDIPGSMIPPFFVPETVPLDTLLTTLQKENKRVAFVVDEYGGTAGLITRGDILEEIVADVENEYEEKQVPIQRIGDSRWLVDGATSLEDINDALDLDLNAEGVDRIAGWTTAQAEHIPRIGEVIEAQSCCVTVQHVRRNRITLVLLEKAVPEQESDNEE